MEAETGKYQVGGQLELPSDTLSQSKMTGTVTHSFTFSMEEAEASGLCELEISLVHRKF